MDSPLASLEKQISKLKKSLDKSNGDAYRGTWLDTVKDRTGAKVYHRLRWFKPDGGKGCRTLKPNEVGEAQRALELWAQIEPLEKEREALQKRIDYHDAEAEKLGGKNRRKSSFEVLTSSETNEWYTPPQYIELARAVMGGIDIDPASNAIAQQWIQAKAWYGKADDGFSQEWRGRLWLNPPYGRLAGQWLLKAIAEYDAGRVSQGIILARGDSQGMKELEKRFPCCSPSNRINFVKADGTPSKKAVPGVRFFYLGENRAAFRKHFGAIGSISVPTMVSA